MLPQLRLFARGALAPIALLLLLVTSRASAVTWDGTYFPNLPLVTQDGTTVRFYDDLLKGKRFIINLMYTSCEDSCPLETARLSQVRRILGDRLGRDIFFYSITVDPDRDTPEVLKSYAEKFQAGAGWLFLSGKKADIELIRRKLGLNARTDENVITAHSTSLLIGNEATGEWIKDSSLDNPQYLATIIRDWLSGWKEGKSAGNYAQAPPVPEYVANRGAYLFQSRCAACHSVGEGERVGPDLAGVTSKRERAWLARFIATPSRVIAEKDPTAIALFNQYRQVRMPDLRLSEVDVKALIGYLEGESSRAGTTAKPIGTARLKAQ